MSKSKKIYILLGALLMICGITFAISRYEDKKEAIRTSDEVILSVAPEEVTSLSWTYGEESLGFHKEESWLYDEDEAFPVDEDVVLQLLAPFESFRASFTIENVEDYSQYGLDDPTCTIQISSGDEQHVIQLGSFSTMDSERYFSIGDGNVYLASYDPYDDYTLDISDMIQHDEIPSISEARLIQFSGTQNSSIIYEEESVNTYCPDDLYFIEGQPLDTSLVTDYLSTLSYLSLYNYVSYNVTDEELAEYGLDTPELIIKIEYPSGEEADTDEIRSFELSIGRNQEELKEARESEDEYSEDSVTAYARVGDSQIVYQITSANYNSLAACSYDDLRHREILTASFDDIYQIDICLDGQEYTITSHVSEGDEDEKIWYYPEDKELDITSLQSAIKALKADSFTDETTGGKEEISLTVYLENDDYPQVDIQLYRYDGSHCIAVLDGQPVSFVTRSLVVNLIEAVNAIVLN